MINPHFKNMYHVLQDDLTFLYSIIFGKSKNKNHHHHRVKDAGGICYALKNINLPIRKIFVFFEIYQKNTLNHNKYMHH